MSNIQLYISAVMLGTSCAHSSALHCVLVGVEWLRIYVAKFLYSPCVRMMSVCTYCYSMMQIRGSGRLPW